MYTSGWFTFRYQNLSNIVNNTTNVGASFAIIKTWGHAAFLGHSRGLVSAHRRFVLNPYVDPINFQSCRKKSYSIQHSYLLVFIYVSYKIKFVSHIIYQTVEHRSLVLSKKLSYKEAFLGDVYLSTEFTPMRDILSSFLSSFFAFCM